MCYQRVSICRGGLVTAGKLLEPDAGSGGRPKAAALPVADGGVWVAGGNGGTGGDGRFVSPYSFLRARLWGVIGGGVAGGG